jgi:hypothetical protein
MRVKGVRSGSGGVVATAVHVVVEMRAMSVGFVVLVL